ncbi:MAG: hypothetical protein ACLQBJ_19730 [Bryobacteraceae bacterium]
MSLLPYFTIILIVLYVAMVLCIAGFVIAALNRIGRGLEGIANALRHTESKAPE